MIIIINKIIQKKKDDNYKNSESEIKEEKLDILRKLCELYQCGFKLPKVHDMNSDIEEMRYDLHKLYLLKKIIKKFA